MYKRLFSSAIVHALLFSVASFKGLIKANIGTHKLFSQQPATLNVDLGDRSYPIYVGQGLLKSGEQLRRHVKAKKALIVTNTVVAPLYSATVRSALEASGIEVFEIILPDGEEYKNMESLMAIMDKAMECKLDRKSIFVALGGGVIGDTAGFAAAIYQRGVKFVQIPTTLMAMVDSSVGGKTAVNHPLGKNIIGAFYQPECVIADIDTLDTLPDREFRSGIAEVIKYGLIRDPEFFTWQEENMEKMVSRDVPVLTETILRSCQNKADVVAADEKEGGVRATLNLGHTFGHAIETGMGYGSWLHGEAVGTGMSMAAELSCRLGLIPLALRDRAISLIRKAGLPITMTNQETVTEVGSAKYSELMTALPTARFLDLMSMDKKVYNGQLNLVLLQGDLGTSVVTDKFDAKELENVVQDYLVSK